MQTGQFASAPNAVRVIASQEGFKGLYAVSNTNTFSLKLFLLVCGFFAV